MDECQNGNGKDKRLDLRPVGEEEVEALPDSGRRVKTFAQFRLPMQAAIFLKGIALFTIALAIPLLYKLANYTSGIPSVIVTI